MTWESQGAIRRTTAVLPTVHDRRDERLASRRSDPTIAAMTTLCSQLAARLQAGTIGDIVHDRVAAS